MLKHYKKSFIWSPSTYSVDVDKCFLFFLSSKFYHLQNEAVGLCNFGLRDLKDFPHLNNHNSLTLLIVKWIKETSVILETENTMVGLTKSLIIFGVLTKGRNHMSW